MAYRHRLIGGTGILLACSASLLGLPVWASAVGGVLCFVYLVGFVRALLVR
jgi:hypothetical protein